MKLCLKILAVGVFAVSTYSLIGCSAPAGYSYSNVSISLVAGCTDCPNGITFNPAYPVPSVNGAQTSTTIPAGAVLTAPPGGGEGGTETFYATVNNAPSTNVSWTIYPTPNLTGITVLPTGTATPVTESTNPLGVIEAASGNTIYYNQPSGAPVYSGEALLQAQALGIPQGDLLLVASAPNDPANPSSVATFNQLIQVYNGSNAQGPPSTYLTPHTPTNPAGLTTPVVTVARNTSYAFYGGAVGAAPCVTAAACGTLPLYSTDNTVIWAVGPAPYALGTAIPGGNATFGTISTSGVYTAPATIPATTTGTSIAGEVVVYAISHLVQTTATYAYVGVN